MRAALRIAKVARICRVAPWTPGPPVPRPKGVPDDFDSDPQDVWSALEDLWLRLQALGMLSVEEGALGPVLVVAGLRRVDRLEPGLRAAVLDVNTYQARQGGRLWPFVQTLSYRGNDLVCELTPPERIARWSEGIDGVGLSWQVRGLVARLKKLQ
jgi:hypothetical protein